MRKGRNIKYLNADLLNSNTNRIFSHIYERQKLISFRNMGHQRRLNLRSSFHSQRSSRPTPSQKPKAQPINPDWENPHGTISMISLSNPYPQERMEEPKKCSEEINSVIITQRHKNLCQSFCLVIREEINLQVVSHVKSRLITVHSCDQAKEKCVRSPLIPEMKFISMSSHQSSNKTSHRMIVHPKKRL